MGRDGLLLADALRGNCGRRGEAGGGLRMPPAGGSVRVGLAGRFCLRPPGVDISTDGVEAIEKEGPPSSSVGQAAVAAVRVMAKGFLLSSRLSV